MRAGQQLKFFRIKLSDWVAFLAVISTCVFQESLLLRWTPRYLADVTAVRMMSWSLYSAFTGLVFFVKVMASYFDALNSINQSCSQACRLSRSSWSILVSFILWISQYSKQSSANIRTVDRTLLGRSLMYTRNNRGPMTMPCGTPDVTGDSEDVWPSSTTSWVHPCQKPVTQLRVEFLMP